MSDTLPSSSSSGLKAWPGISVAEAAALLGHSLDQSNNDFPWPPGMDDALRVLEGEPYEVIGRIGYGGMGAVFKVRNLEPGIGRIEAVKIRRPRIHEDVVFRRRFLDEIGTLAGMRHPGLTTLFRSGESSGGVLWFSMEHIEGEPLAALLVPGRPTLAPERVTDIAGQLCETLRFIHSGGRVHRDLKPANVMIARDGVVRLLDFGIASFCRSESPSSLSEGIPHTPGYTAPEQLTGGEVDGRADLFGLGRILQDMIGHSGGGGEGSFSRLSELAGRLVAEDPDERPRNAAEVLGMLGELEPGAPGFWGRDCCPFMGLSAFQPEHASIFFGRGEAVIRACSLLRGMEEGGIWNGFLLITGSSGSGKSSLARAGIAPAILAGSPENRRWDTSGIVVFDMNSVRAGDITPLNSMLDLFQHECPDLRAFLDRGVEVSVPGGRGGDCHKMPVCVVIDQLEHLFRSGFSPDDRSYFVSALVRLARLPGVTVLATLRSDAYGHCGTWPELMALKEGRHLDLPAPQLWELSVMIRQGARASALRFDSDPGGRSLDEVLLAHARSNTQALPLLSYVLEQLWQRRDIRSNTLLFSSYEELGGFEGAVAEQAKAACSAFASEHPYHVLDAFDALFRLLVDTSETGVTMAFSRRTADIEELSALHPVVWQLAERLISARLLVKDGSGLSLAHDLLLSPQLVERWPQLGDWLDRSASLLRTRSRIGARMREGSPLLDGDPLLEVAKAHMLADSQAFSLDQTAYVRSAVESAGSVALRTARRRNLVLVAFGLLTASASIAGGIAWRMKSAADGQAAIAETRRKQADAANEETRRALGISHFLQSVQMIEAGRIPEALAHLARSLGSDPANVASSGQAAFLLTYHDFPIPLLRLDHDEKVWSASYSPDGNMIATASWNGAVRRWDAKTGFQFPATIRQSDIVYIADFSPDGSRIVTAGGDNVACVWDTASGVPLFAPIEHGDDIRWAAFSPDGGKIVTASQDHTARIWNAVTGEPIGTILTQGEKLRMACFSPDGTRIATACEDGTAMVWDSASGLAVSRPMRHFARCNSAKFSPDGKRLVTASFDGTAQVWDPNSGNSVLPVLRHAEEASWKTEVNTAEFSPDGKTIVTASWDRTARIWDATTGAPLVSPLYHPDYVMSAVFSPDGTRVLTATLAEGFARIWDARTGRPLFEPIKHHDYIRCARFSPDGTKAVTASTDRTARVWNVQSGMGKASPVFHEGRVTSANFSPDGKRVVTASADGCLRVWNSYTGKLVAGPMRAPEMEGAIDTCEFDRDGRHILALSHRATASVWDSFTGNLVADRIGGYGTPRACRFSPDGTRFLNRSAPKVLRIWNTVGGTPVGKPISHQDGDILCAEFNPDGTRIVTSSAEGCARIWDARTGERIGERMVHGGDVYTVAFSPDGNRIVTSSSDETARVWDGCTGSPICPPMRNRAVVGSAIFSPDGKKVATSTFGGGTAQLWDAETGNILTQIMRHRDFVNSVCFSPDSRFLATASRDGSARVWDVATGRPVTDPLPHGDRVTAAGFSNDCQRLLTVAGGRARIWDLWPAGQAPPWMPVLIEAVAGEKLNDLGVFQDPAGNPAQVLSGLLEMFEKAPDGDPWVRWGRWYLADRLKRAPSPFSSVADTPTPPE